MSTLCVVVQESLQTRLDGDLIEESQEELVIAHLATCSACSSFQHDLERLIGVVERMPLERAPESFMASVINSLPAPERLPVSASWLRRNGLLWAPLVGLVGFLLAIYHAAAVYGVSLLNLPQAIGEWANMLDAGNLSSVLDATSIFAWSVGIELLIGVSLLLVAIFAVMVHVLNRPPVMAMPAARRA